MPGKLLLLAMLSLVVEAQWIDYRAPGTPRTPDGKPDLTAPAPKALDGKPDLSGVWMHEVTTPAEMRRLFGKRIDEAIAVDVPGMEIGTQHKYAFDILVDHQPEAEMLRPAAAERLRKNMAAGVLNGCPAPGGPAPSSAPAFPLMGLLSEPIKIVQAPQTTIVLYEAGNLHRQIHTDGRELPTEFDLPAFNGYSAGRWEGDTLIVETAGFNERTPLDAAGHPHSDALRVTERLRRRDYGHLDYEITFDDPKMYTKPFTVRIPHDLLPDADIFETYPENEKDIAHICKR